MLAHGNQQITIVQGEPDLPDFDIDLIVEDPDYDLLSDPMLGSI